MSIRIYPRDCPRNMSKNCFPRHIPKKLYSAPCTRGPVKARPQWRHSPIPRDVKQPSHCNRWALQRISQTHIPASLWCQSREHYTIEFYQQVFSCMHVFALLVSKCYQRRDNGISLEQNGTEEFTQEQVWSSGWPITFWYTSHHEINEQHSRRFSHSMQLK